MKTIEIIQKIELLDKQIYLVGLIHGNLDPKEHSLLRSTLNGLMNYGIIYEIYYSGSLNYIIKMQCKDETLVYGKVRENLVRNGFALKGMKVLKNNVVDEYPRIAY